MAWNLLLLRGSPATHAAGIAYALRRSARGEQESARGGPTENMACVLTFFGDGATSEGDFHEALNFAGVFRLPVVFLCQNNQWAISTPRRRQTAAPTLAQKALAYGVPGLQVDGNDVLASYVAARDAVARARQGGGPTMIEALTYRMEVHTTADDPDRYRNPEETRRWAERDPIARLQRYLEARGLLDAAAVDDLEAELEALIHTAWKQAQRRIEALAHEPHAMFDHVTAGPDPEVAAERRRFLRWQGASRG